MSGVDILKNDRPGLNRSKQILDKYLHADEGMSAEKVAELLGLHEHDILDLEIYEQIIPSIKDCYYVAGPMSGIDHHNFPAFDNASDTLRSKKIEVISPAELDTDKGRQNALNTVAGVDQVTQGDSKWAGFLERDLRVVAATKGTIVIDGWEGSQGAKLETFVADKLGKELVGVYPKLKPLDRGEWVRQGIVRDY